MSNHRVPCSCSECNVPVPKKADPQQRAYFIVQDHLRNLRTILDAIERNPLETETNRQLTDAGSQVFFNLGQFLTAWKRVKEQPN